MMLYLGACLVGLICWLAIGVVALRRNPQMGSWVAMLSDRRQTKKVWLGPAALLLCLLFWPMPTLAARILLLLPTRFLE